MQEQEERKRLAKEKEKLLESQQTVVLQMRAEGRSEPEIETYRRMSSRRIEETIRELEVDHTVRKKEIQETYLKYHGASYSRDEEELSFLGKYEFKPSARSAGVGGSVGSVSSGTPSPSNSTLSTSAQNTPPPWRYIEGYAQSGYSPSGYSPPTASVASLNPLVPSRLTSLKAF